MASLSKKSRRTISTVFAVVGFILFLAIGLGLLISLIFGTVLFFGTAFFLNPNVQRKFDERAHEKRERGEHSRRTRKEAEDWAYGMEMGRVKAQRHQEAKDFTNWGWAKSLKGKK